MQHFSINYDSLSVLTINHIIMDDVFIAAVIFAGIYMLVKAVSYTHLTLPTIYSV